MRKKKGVSEGHKRPLLKRPSNKRPFFSFAPNMQGALTVPAELPEANVHSIPSKTSYSGPARVSSFFQPVVDTAQQKLQAAQVVALTPAAAAGQASRPVAGRSCAPGMRTAD